MQTVRLFLTTDAMEHLFAGAVLQFPMEELMIQVALELHMRDEIEKAMLALLPTSPTVN